MLATELYNLDFTPPDTGSYSVVFGSPAVQSSVGPLSDALVFHAVTTFDQIALPISVAGSQYNIQFDVLTHQLLDSQYAFSVILDTTDVGVRNTSFHGGLDAIDVYQPSPYTDAPVGGFLDDQVYHVSMLVDFQANLWSLAVDGTQLYSNHVNASGLTGLRFSMNPWTGLNPTDAPGTYAAIDNVVVTVVPEPASGVLALCVWAISLRYGFLPADCAGERGFLTAKTPRTPSFSEFPTSCSQH